MKKLIETSILEILLLGAFLNICEAQNNAQLFHFTPQAGIRFFNWIETLSNGDELLEEDGMLYGLGFNTKTKFSKKLGVYLRSDGALYFGTVDYAGSLQYHLLPQIQQKRHEDNLLQIECQIIEIQLLKHYLM